MRKILESKIQWRGSVTDLATDVAYLLTPEEGESLIRELLRFQEEPHLADKWAGRGHEEVDGAQYSSTRPRISSG